ncbi:MAG: hypothetical protein ACP5FK_11225 [bacterium]
MNSDSIKFTAVISLLVLAGCSNPQPEPEIIHLPNINNVYFKFIWSKNLPGTPTYPLFLSDSAILVGTDEGTLHQYSLTRGELIREIGGMKRLTGIAPCKEGIAILSYSGYLDILDYNFNCTAREILPGIQFYPPVVADNYLCCYNIEGTAFIVESEQLHIYSVKTENMWGTGRTGIIAEGNSIYSISENGLWKIDVGGKTIDKSSQFDSLELLTDLWVGHELIAVSNSWGEIKLVDKHNFQILYHFITGLNCPVKTTVQDNYLYYQSNCGELGCVELVNYSLMWKYQLKGNSYTKPLVIGDIILTGDDQGYLYKLNRWSGMELNLKKITDQNIIEIVRHDRYLIIMGLKGGLYVLVET